MEAPDFWNDPERSQQLMKELKSKKSELIMNMEKSTAKNGVDAIIDIIMKSIC